MAEARAHVDPATSIRTGGVRAAASFARDPGAFTAGPGIALGDFYRLRLPGNDIHVVTRPDLIEEILVTRGEHFEKSRIYWGELRRIIGDGLGSLEGDRWKVLRKLEQPFFTPRASADSLPTVRDETHGEFDDLEAWMRSEGGALTLPALELAARLNTRIFLQVLFGREVGEKRVEFARRIVDGEDTIAWRSKFPWRFLTGWLSGKNWRARAHRAYFQTFADQVEASPTPDDDDRLVGALRGFRADESAPEYGDELLRNEIVVHLGAGSETQGVAQGWCLYLLWRHPWALEEIRAEVDRVAEGGAVEIRHLSRLEYTLQVLRETLRLFPTAYAMVRDCVEPTPLGGGYPARKRQVFFISLVGLHRSPRFWDEPEVFRPDRFRPDRYDALGRFQYMPFGGGRHVCIGQHVALPTMILAIAEFARRFDWSFPRDDVPVVGRSTLKPKGDFRVTLRPRGRG